MVTSMTGFGRASAPGPRGAVTVEVRTVNNRFLDLTVRGSNQVPLQEERIRERVRSRMERGKVTVAVSVEGNAEETPQPDLERARSYRDALRVLGEELRLAGEPDLGMIASFRDIFVGQAQPPDEEAEWAAVEVALETALEACWSMRRREGEALALDLTERIGRVAAGLAEIERLAPDRLRAYADRLRGRITELVAGPPPDQERLEQELVLYADRIDVSEECTRLRSHLAQFREAMEGEAPAGRTLNFLLQEMHREVNTIGSKANDAEITRTVVALKEELEKIREQVQNIE
jgi:uncharacterized protein (TIGR00255 family)